MIGGTWSKLIGQMLGSLLAGLYFPVSTLSIATPAVCSYKIQYYIILDCLIPDLSNKLLK